MDDTLVRNDPSAEARIVHLFGEGCNAWQFEAKGKKVDPASRA